MQNQIKKAINLSKRTGDRIIIVDQSDSENAFVIMNLDEYEKLIAKNEQSSQEIGSLTENELLDRINRDIAIWKNEQNLEDWEVKEGLDQGKEDDLEDESLYYYDNEEEADLYEKYFSDKENVKKFNEEIDEFGANEKNDEKTGKSNNNPWRIPKQVKESAEEVLEEDFYQ